MQPTNNARIKCISVYFAVHDYALIDKGQGIWRGNRVIEVGTPADAFTSIYFTRESRPDDVLQEYEFESTKLIGFPFLLVPKDRMLFGYDEPSNILKPDINLSKPNLFNRDIG